jgi:UDPglucose 6-dehydrogenase
MRITIVGSGYVGFSNALVLAKKHDVFVIDNDISKVNQINNNNYSFFDEDIMPYLSSYHITISASHDYESAYLNSDIIIVCVPTNHHQLNERICDNIVSKTVVLIHNINPDVIIVVRSTMPIGSMHFLKLKHSKILYMPEFLREGYALYDALNPSRFVISGDHQLCLQIHDLFNQVVENQPEHIVTGFEEAEAIKLFSNTYLAMRVSFFNEVDSFAMERHLNMKSVIDGICSDNRIGRTYNNPSFGYGGYCLPKDVKEINTQMNSSYSSLIKSINDSNEKRMNNIVNHIIKIGAKTIGIYRLISKSGVSNYRESVQLKIAYLLKEQGTNVIIFEPTSHHHSNHIFEYIDNFNEFEQKSDLIIANRMCPELNQFRNKVFTRDLFGNN